MKQRTLNAPDGHFVMERAIGAEMPLAQRHRCASVEQIAERIGWLGDARTSCPVGSAHPVSSTHHGERRSIPSIVRSATVCHKGRGHLTLFGNSGSRASGRG
jgi:hypothetical protein